MVQRQIKINNQYLNNFLQLCIKPIFDKLLMVFAIEESKQGQRGANEGANKSHVALWYKYGSVEVKKTELSSRGSLEMSLLIFTLLSTALAVPPPCPPMAPMDCGEGRMKCPGPINPLGCKMPDSCVAVGDRCPVQCPHRPPINCGPGRMTCPGLLDPMGCKKPDSCVAVGDRCPVH